MFKSCFKGLPDHLGTSPLLQPRTPSSKAKLEEITKQFKCSEKAVQMIQMNSNEMKRRVSPDLFASQLPGFVASIVPSNISALCRLSDAVAFANC